MQTHLSIENFSERFQQWVQEALPRLNTAVENGQMSLDDIVAAFKPWAESLTHDWKPDLPFLSRAEARHLLQLLGFGLGSIEKHAQAQTPRSHRGIATFDGLQIVLADLATLGAHPPRDSHYTYWLYNRDVPSLSFTGNAQEYFFNRSVNQTDDLHNSSCRALRPICEGSLSLLHKTALEAILLTAENMRTLHRAFRAFMDKNDQQQRNMEPDFFMRRMRTYLPTYQINGVEWSGANAANLASQMQVDYLLGTVNAEYADIVSSRFRYLTVEDQFALQHDMQLPSIFDVLLAHLRLDMSQFTDMPPDRLKAHLALQSSTLQTILCAYQSAVQAAAYLTAMHWALIQNYLVKPAQHMSEAEKSKVGFRPDVGVGGKTHAETASIMRMRREHPMVWKLIDAVQEVYHV